MVKGRNPINEETTPEAEVKETVLTTQAPEAGALVIPPGMSLLDVIREKIQEINPEFKDIGDLIRIGQWVTIGGRKNEFVIKERDMVVDNLGDPVEIIPIDGAQVYQRWATDEERKAGEEGLMCYSVDKQQTNCYGELCKECTYGRDHCSPRFLLKFFVATRPAEEGMPFPPIYMTNLSKSSGIEFGKMYSAVTNGTYRALGIRPFTPLSKLVLQMTVDQASQNGQNWTFAKFKPVRVRE